MLVSHRHRFIFLKTRKTASTSVEMALQPYCAENMSEPVEEAVQATVSDDGIIGARKIPRKKLTGLNARWFNHMSAADIAAQLGSDQFSGYTKITSIRNPFDQLVSQCHWQVHQGRASYETFDELRVLFRRLILKSNWPNDYEIVHLNGRYIIDFAVRFEHLSLDIKEVADKIELDPLYLNLPHTKDTSYARAGRAAAEYYDPDTIEFVRQKMAWIFEHFDYPDKPSEIAR